MTISKQVLVIEDDAIIMECLEAIFEVEGLSSLGAADGKAGLALAREHRPSLIVCDLHMPGITGLDVLKSVRSDPDLSHVSFLIITADASEEAYRRSMQLGADAFLLKPFGPDAFMDTVRDLLGEEQPT